ncbi:phospholipase A1-II 1-like [Pistacia vera]|uniref:phospholipase A1-II 1-like n=1 Tax=Pistacia vera TaxID=55513 RepID=UPI001262EA5F|nr:phospholipase A1-II 1-like [Pistacia vera]
MDDQWKKLSGAGNWDGLLEPLHKVLQKRLKLYCESIQVIYDSVSNHDKRQPAHKKEDLFSKPKTKELETLYTVTHYIYARSDVPSLVNWIVKDKSAWIGYVAVATDEGKEVLGRRDILICWRGTNSKTEGLKDCECSLISASDIFGKTHNPHVHKGFLSLYKSPNIEPPSYNDLSARDQVLHAVKTLMNKVDYRDEEISITVTGHSLGAALATLSATDIVANKHNRRKGSDKKCMVTAFVFATPKVGDKGFRDVFDQLSELHLLRIKNKLDVVPKLPPLPAYEHVGIKLKIESYKELLPKLKELLSKLKEGLHFHSLKQHVVGLGRTTRSMFHRETHNLRKADKCLVRLCHAVPRGEFRPCDSGIRARVEMDALRERVTRLEEMLGEIQDVDLTNKRLEALENDNVLLKHALPRSLDRRSTTKISVPKPKAFQGAKNAKELENFLLDMK